MTSQRGFERWLSAHPEHAETYTRFVATLGREGVADVVPNYQLWRADRLSPECIVDAYAAPPEELWPNIVPALRFVRDHVEPQVGEVEVASAYRDPAFNECIGGAPQSRHKNFYALDLLPLDRSITREALIERLCPLHAREGPRFDIGLGIYRARRFHIDAAGYRGWGADFRGATFPCSSNG